MEEIIRLQNYEPFWGEWKVVSLLHEGSLASVYRVENGTSKGIIKVIPIPKVQNDFRNSSRTLENTEAMEKFCKEVVDVLEEELGRLEGLNTIPNVLGYRKYEAFDRREEVGFDLVLLMDEEQNLADYVAEHCIKNEEIVKIVKDVAWILDKAHQEGIVHKDIKIENIFMTETGESMLADFSLARKIESYQSRDQRRSNTVYTAPEVLSEYDFNKLTDVYALGMVLYSLLNDGDISSVFEHRNAKTVIPEPKRAGEKLSEIVMKAIAYRAKDRYVSAEEFFKALYELKEQDFDLPAKYVEAEKRKQEQLAKKEAEKRKQEQLAKEAQEKKRQEELAKEEEEKKRQEELEEQKRQEELAREAEERKKQEELARQEEERKRQEELARQEEERKRQEELARQEEERKRQEELARQEEERKRQEELARQEEERKKQEELARQEEEKKKQEELKRQQEQLRREAELERRRIVEEKIEKERKENGEPFLSRGTALFEEETLGSAASQLNSSMEKMEQIAEVAQSEIRKEEGSNSQTLEKLLDYSMSQEKEELLDEIIASVSVEHHHMEAKEKKVVDNKTLLETFAAEKDGEPEVKLHADITEYGGFFDFSKEAYQAQNDKNEIGYDKNIDTEPYEQKMIDYPKQKMDKKNVIIFVVLFILVAGGVYIAQNQEFRANLQEVYDNAIQYFSNQSTDVDSGDGMIP